MVVGCWWLVGAWLVGSFLYKCSMPNVQFPMPKGRQSPTVAVEEGRWRNNAQCPIPNAPFPISI
ncbi:MAG: hypothetical protein ACHBN1_27745 [Heteroscytonema crispum UTEX LB 1556]